MADKFKAGDLVQLKSGGPKLTLESIESSGWVYVTWFAGSKHERARVRSETIQLYVEPEKTTKK